MELRRLSLFSVLAALCTAPVSAAQRTEVRQAGIPLDLAQFGARTLANTGGLEIVPVLAGERLLVSSTRRLLALDAPTGTLGLWSTLPHEGWETLAPKGQRFLLAGVDAAGLLVQAATGERVAVASLQLSFSRSETVEWHGISRSKSADWHGISIPLPERRLFAFDLASGRPLWNHAPSASWDGETGPFEQRMNLVASPLVVGERVLVPCTRDASSIDYHVVCYELGTGRLLWTTFVARGQVERDMFGLLGREFTAAPLVATPDGAGVIAQTGLGRIVFLDLGTGAIRWRREYDSIPLEESMSFRARVRWARWRTTAPLVVDGLVLSTPRDSEELLILDLATGESRGGITERWLHELEVGFHPKTTEAHIDHLVGALGNRLYLGGEQLIAVERLGGLGSEAPWKVAWARTIGANSAARAQLAGESLFVADGQGLLELDPRDGSTLRSYLVGDVASVLVTDDALFALGRDHLTRLAR